MTNNWIQHCKNYQAKHGCSWACALKGARASYRSMSGSGGKITPTLLSVDPAPAANNIFNPPLPSKQKQPKRGTDEWYKKKEKSSSSFLQSLMDKIERNEGEFGKAKNKKAFKVDDITKIGRKKKSKDHEEIKINKKKPNKSSIDAILKKEKQKWKKLFQNNQVDGACKPNQARVKSYCRRKR